MSKKSRTKEGLRQGVSIFKLLAFIFLGLPVIGDREKFIELYKNFYSSPTIKILVCIIILLIIYAALAFYKRKRYDKKESI